MSDQRHHGIELQVAEGVQQVDPQGIGRTGLAPFRLRRAAVHMPPQILQFLHCRVHVTVKRGPVDVVKNGECRRPQTAVAVLESAVRQKGDDVGDYVRVHPVADTVVPKFRM